MTFAPNFYSSDPWRRLTSPGHWRTLEPMPLILVLLLFFLPLFGQSVHPLTGRPIAHVMSAAGSDWLDRPERESEEHPDQALEALAIKRGMVVADVGAG